MPVTFLWNQEHRTYEEEEDIKKIDGHREICPSTETSLPNIKGLGDEILRVKNFGFFHHIICIAPVSLCIEREYPLFHCKIPYN